MGNTFGQLFRVTTFGESHGGGVGVVIDGCPPKIDISETEIQRELDRRRPGQSKITTQRKEEDRCKILSGVFAGKTLGTPIAVLVHNKDARPEDYLGLRENFDHHMPISLMRPSMEFGTGRVVAARRRAKPSDESRRAQSRKRYCRSYTRSSRLSPTLCRFMRSLRRSIVPP